MTPSSPRATVASIASDERFGRTDPATSAPTPTMAARLKAFDPSTTPSPTSRSPRTIAAIDDASSGPSAARAVSTPSNASVNPSRVPTRSSRSANSAAATSVTPRAARKANEARMT